MVFALIKLHNYLEIIYKALTVKLKCKISCKWKILVEKKNLMIGKKISEKNTI